MPKEVKKIYYPTSEELRSASICWKNNIAFCMKRYGTESELYYIEKYDCSKPTIRGLYLRKDTTKPYSFTNRLMLNEYSAWEKVFELYKAYAKSIVKTPEESTTRDLAKVLSSKKESSITKQKPIRNTKKQRIKEDISSSVNQVDLLDMIAECEKEQGNQNLT